MTVSPFLNFTATSRDGGRSSRDPDRVRQGCRFPPPQGRFAAARRCASGRTRTHNQRGRNPLLSPLSYRGGESSNPSSRITSEVGTFHRRGYPSAVWTGEGSGSATHAARCAQSRRSWATFARPPIETAATELRHDKRRHGSGLAAGQPAAQTAFTVDGHVLPHDLTVHKMSLCRTRRFPPRPTEWAELVLAGARRQSPSSSRSRSAPQSGMGPSLTG